STHEFVYLLIGLRPFHYLGASVTDLTIGSTDWGSAPFSSFFSSPSFSVFCTPPVPLDTTPVAVMSRDPLFIAASLLS
ncbi:hypothetical protein PENTCL1PPCAC_26629, partial [Pristionchus entomophagus]